MSGEAYGIVALIVAIVVFFIVVILYLLYYLNVSNVTTYGLKWHYKNVSDDTALIEPVGQVVYSVNGNSTSRGSNPDYLLIRKPDQGPYSRVPFIIYNYSNQGSLTLQFDSGVTINNIPSPYVISEQTGVMFIWSNKNTIVPLIAGAQYNG